MRWNNWFYCLFIALVYTAVWGYMFNTGDQAEHLPQVYHLQEPSLYKGDFFIEEYGKQFTIRNYYVATVFALSKLMPVLWVCFILHLLCTAFFAFGIFKITQILTTGKLAPYVAPLFAMVLFRNITVGGNAVFDIQFITSSVAMPLALWAFYKMLNSRFVTAGSFAGLATVAHPVIGLQAFLIIFAIVLINNKKIFFGDIVYTLLAYIGFAAAMMIPLAIRQLATPATGNENLFLTLLYDFRNYTHYLPHNFPLKDYIFFTLLLGAGALLLFRSKSENTSLLKQFFFIIVGGLLFYSICMETHVLWNIGKIQWFKTTVWLSVFSSILIAIFFSNWVEKFFFREKLMRLYRPVISVLSGVMFFFILNSAFIPGLGERYQIGNYEKSDRTRMNEWIEQNLRIDAVVLNPPTDDAFACQAKRSQPVSFKAIIHEPAYMLKWYDKVSEIYGITLENTQGKRAVTEAGSLYKERNYKEHITHQDVYINFRIDNIHTCQYIDNLGAIVHREGDWVLTVF